MDFDQNQEVDDVVVVNNGDENDQIEEVDNVGFGNNDYENDQNQEVENVGNNGNETVIQPAVGMSFENGQEYADFCHVYASRSGFQFYTRSCEVLDEFKGTGKGRRKSGEEPQYHMMKRLRLVCTRGGNFNAEQNSRSQVTGCKAYVDARVQQGRITITIMDLDHNHPMDPLDSPYMTKYKYMTDYRRRRDNPVAGGDGEGKEFELIRKIEILEREKKQMASEAYRLKRKNGDELERNRKSLVANVAAMEANKRRFEEGKNLELIRRIQVLEREKEQMVGVVSKLNRENADSAKRIVELDAECDQLKEEKVKLKQEVVEVKGKEEKTNEKYAKVKEKYVETKGNLDSEKQKWREEEERVREKCRQLEVEKKKLEIDLKEAAREKAAGDEAVMKLRAAEASIKSLVSCLEDRERRIADLLQWQNSGKRGRN